MTATNPDGDMKPCPFCGEAGYLTRNNDVNGHLLDEWAIGCETCDYWVAAGPVGLGFFARKSDALAYWNTRLA